MVDRGEEEGRREGRIARRRDVGVGRREEVVGTKPGGGSICSVVLNFDRGSMR